MQPPPKPLAVLIAVAGVVSAMAVMYGVVPRIRLVEAVSLFATAFAAGAGLAVALIGRPDSSK
jgi:hypothetical protein